MGKRRQATRAQEDRAGTANADRRQRWHAVANNTTELKPLLLATLTALVASFVLAGGLQRVQQELDVRGWLGRPALALTGARALLIVGTMGSGIRHSVRPSCAVLGWRWHTRRPTAARCSAETAR